MNDPSPSSSHPSTSSQPIPTAIDALDDDPFVASTPGANLDDPFRPSITSHYDDDPPAYPSNPHAFASSTSLIPIGSSPTSPTVDDFTHLTATPSTTNMNPNNMGIAAVNNDHDHDDWRTDSEQHMFGDDTSHTRRRLEERYSANLSPSPFQQSGTTIKRLSRGLRDVSWRVVNFAGAGLDGYISVPDGGNQVDATGDGRRRPSSDNDEDGDGRSVQQLADLRRVCSLRGRSLCLFGSTSRIRRSMYEFLIFPGTEPLILCSIIFYAVLLTIQSARTLTLSSPTATPPAVHGYFHSVEDYIIFGLFVFFSFEAFARICVSGLILDPEVSIRAIFTHHRDPPTDASIAHPIPSTSATYLGRKDTLYHLRNFYGKVTKFFALSPGTAAGHAVSSSPMADTTAPLLKKPSPPPPPPSTLQQQLQQNQEEKEVLFLPFQFSVSLARRVTRRNLPYLRHSWTRTDAVSVIAFWISFVLAQTGVEHSSTRHLGVFRALSVLRTARLLSITSGTTTIMHSLKTARPLLVSVTYFVLFAMTLFSVIGVQSFNGSLLRSCYLEPTLGEGEASLKRSCGGHIDPNTLHKVPYITRDGRNVTMKGYICPLGQLCKEGSNPQSNIQSFDTIYYSALQVFIIASANSWSTLMYSVMDSDFFISCLFFIICLIVLNFWLINLFVAVITNTFSAIKTETRLSAFSSARIQAIVDEQDEATGPDARRHKVRRNVVKKVYKNIRLCWVALALASLVLQATRGVDISPMHARILNVGELVITILFDIEIVVRIIAYLPEWRFFAQGHNYLDLVLAIGSTIIQIPVVRHSKAYPWLTIFQLARFYRVILVIPRMRPLLLSVFANMGGLVNMVLFLMIVNYLAALFVAQILRGDMQGTLAMNFGEIFTSFLAIYQVFTSENWASVLYNSAQAEVPLGQAVIVVLFFVGWFFFANFIILQMFIAVINENFDIAEEAKRSQQVHQYFQTTEGPDKTWGPWIDRLNPYGWFKPSPKTNVVENYGHSTPERRPTRVRSTANRNPVRRLTDESLNILQRLFVGDTQSNDIPLTTLSHVRKNSELHQNTGSEETETDRYLDLLASIDNDEVAAAAAERDNLNERKAVEADFIRNHPTYDRTFWVLSQKNPLRTFCQKLVRPVGGERIYGARPSTIAHTIFQSVLLVAVIGGIAVGSIATPLYRRNFFATHGHMRGSWFGIAESVFGLTLVVEFVIKIIADGFLFTPNSYVRSIWNVLDFFIMAGIVVNVVTGLIFVHGLSRLTRSLKALRALKLITLIEKMRSTFESLIISGITRILDAALLAMLYMIPYAVWGLNIFAGLMNTCNDTIASGQSDCINEYQNSVVTSSTGSSALTFPVPRVWANPSPSTTFSFDTFRSSLLILFEIASLEGWTDVMGAATSITGPNSQPQTNASQVNAIFFVVYNLLGGVVILTLFVSIIIGNFRAKTGAALLTQPQREWIDLQKLLKRQRPSKRPRIRPTSARRAWCYDRAVNKHGWWTRMMTALFTAHIIALMTQTFSPQKLEVQDIRNDFFLFVTIMYTVDIHVRLYGLGWPSFRANGWNVFDIVVASGSLLTTISVRLKAGGYVIDQLQKLFLVSIAFKLVQRMNSLNKLFKTAVSSLPVIFSLFSLWLVLFMFFGILFVEIFSMTKWNTNETRYQNYSSMGRTLVMLAFMTAGENWNQYMHDFSINYPRCTISSLDKHESDCGSTSWAYTLFIAWNVLSSYIFVNMFTGLVVENFSYVYQTTGGAKSVTREEMRAFKKVWAEFANPMTELLECKQLVPFLRKLGGIFEVRIYPTEFSYRNISDSCRDTTDPDPRSSGLDLRLLSAAMSRIDYEDIRRRRKLFSRLYHEAIITHQHKEISFTDMLLLLAHHKLIVDDEALSLKELAIRVGTNELVDDLVDKDRVRSFLEGISIRRRFLSTLKEARKASAAEHGARGRVLLAHGADVNIQNEADETVLHLTLTLTLRKPCLIMVRINWGAAGQRTRENIRVVDVAFEDDPSLS